MKNNRGSAEMIDGSDSGFKNCAYCGDPFKPYRNDQKYCGKRCLKNALNELDGFSYKKRKSGKQFADHRIVKSKNKKEQRSQA